MILLHGLGQASLARTSPSEKSSAAESAFALGGAWAIATVIAAEQGTTGQNFARVWEMVTALGQGLHVVPPRPEAKAAKANMWSDLMSRQDRIRRELEKRHGVVVAGVFTLATIASAVELADDDATLRKAARLIGDSAAQAHVPAAIIKPLIDRLQAGGGATDLREISGQVVSDIGDHLVRNRAFYGTLKAR